MKDNGQHHDAKFCVFWFVTSRRLYLLADGVMKAKAEQIAETVIRLRKAIAARRSMSSCLKLWSIFIRTRDGNRCVACSTKRELSAHHICRKSFMAEAQLQTGNGITLCGKCHKEIHIGYNGRPDFQQPMDAQGGEKIETLCALFGLLVSDARERKVLCNELYYLSNKVLSKFKMLQGFDPFTEFPGFRLEQAHLIWLQSPLQLRNAILEANGLPILSDPIFPGITIRDIK